MSLSITEMTVSPIPIRSGKCPQLVPSALNTFDT